MSGGFLGSFSGALDGVTEADVAALDAQRTVSASVQEIEVKVSVEDDVATDAAPAVVEPSERLVPPIVRDAARGLLAGSIFVERSEPTEPVTLWVHTDEEVREVRFGEPILLGRVAPAGETAFLRVANDKVSREHCGVRVVDGRATCVDLGSTNGTWIDRLGEIIEVHDVPVAVADGDKICTMVNHVVIATVSSTGERS